MLKRKFLLGAGAALIFFVVVAAFLSGRPGVAGDRSSEGGLGTASPQDTPAALPDEAAPGRPVSPPDHVHVASSHPARAVGASAATRLALNPNSPRAAETRIPSVPDKIGEDADSAAMDRLVVHGWGSALYRNGRPKVRKEAINAPFIALTFDDGPKPDGTPQILADLRQYQAHATFFVVGKQCALFPGLLSQISAEGNEIGNHTYDHFRLPTIPATKVAQELERNRAIIRRITGHTVYLFRPPGGRTNPQVQTLVDSLGYTTVFWAVDSGELATDMTPEMVYHRVVDSVTDGDIVLLHNGDSKILEVLPRILANLSQRGYQFVTVSELMQLNGARPVEATEMPEVDIE